MLGELILLAAAVNSWAPPFPYPPNPKQEIAVARETCSAVMLQDCLLRMRAAKSKLRQDWLSPWTSDEQRKIIASYIDRAKSSTGIDWIDAQSGYLSEVQTAQIRGRREAGLPMSPTRGRVSSECRLRSGNGWAKVDCTTNEQ